MRGYLPLSPHVSSGLMTPLRRRRFWGQQPPYPLPSTYRSIIWVSYCYLIDYFVNNLYSLDLICTYDIEDFFSKLEHKFETIMLFKTNGDNLQQHTYFYFTLFMSIVSKCVSITFYFLQFNLLFHLPCNTYLNAYDMFSWIPNLRIHKKFSLFFSCFLCNLNLNKQMLLKLFILTKNPHTLQLHL